MYGSEQFFQQSGVSRETLSVIKEYVSILLHWQKSINLIGLSTVDEIWRRHVLDSAQLNQYLHKSGQLFDLGSGAGFPGIIIAIMGRSNVTLIDSSEKKCAFLREASRSLGIEIEVKNVRIEDYKPKKRAKYITSRALAPLDKLLYYSEPLLESGGKCIFHKGANFEIELTQAKKNWNMVVQKHISMSDSRGVVLEIAELTSIDERYQST